MDSQQQSMACTTESFASYFYYCISFPTITMLTISFQRECELIYHFTHLLDFVVNCTLYYAFSKAFLATVILCLLLLPWLSTIIATSIITTAVVATIVVVTISTGDAGANYW
jgi:hypothetical protein